MSSTVVPEVPTLRRGAMWKFWVLSAIGISFAERLTRDGH